MADGSSHNIWQSAKGQSIADKISVVPTGSNDRPATPVIIKKIIIKDKQ